MDESVPYTKRKLESLLSLDDFEQAARRYLPRVLFAYVSGGVETNASMDQNRAVFEELGFIPRVMRDVSNVDIQVDLWGQIGRAHSELQSLMRSSYAVLCLKK